MSFYKLPHTSSFCTIIIFKVYIHIKLMCTYYVYHIKIYPAVFKMPTKGFSFMSGSTEIHGHWIPTDWWFSTQLFHTYSQKCSTSLWMWLSSGQWMHGVLCSNTYRTFYYKSVRNSYFRWCNITMQIGWNSGPLSLSSKVNCYT